VAPTTPVTAAVEVTGEIDELTGEVLITTVAVRPTTTGGAFVALLDRARDLTVPGTVIPEEIDEEEFFRQQRDIFRESVQVAAAVGLQEAGREVHLEGGGAQVLEVLPGAPAAGTLEPGDVVVEAEDQDISFASELQAITTGADAGQTLALVVVRDEEEVELDITVDVIEETGDVGLGVLVRTVDQEFELPEDVDFEVHANIGGPSGGLMLALTIYDLFAEEDLVAGRTIAGTGTVDLAGRVGPVGGVDKKVLSAGEAGADVFLVPAPLEDLARDSAPDGVEVVPVETFADALEALRG
jgi:Lon-like protease